MVLTLYSCIFPKSSYATQLSSPICVCDDTVPDLARSYCKRKRCVTKKEKEVNEMDLIISVFQSYPIKHYFPHIITYYPLAHSYEVMEVDADAVCCEALQQLLVMPGHAWPWTFLQYHNALNLLSFLHIENTPTLCATRLKVCDPF